MNRLLTKSLQPIFLLATSLLGTGVFAAGLELKQVADGIYVHQGIHELPDHRNHGEIANIGFIVGDRCVAVIDTGGTPSQGRALRAAVEQTTRVPICYVINTHVHPDHIYGNIAFQQPGVAFVGHRKLPEAMAKRAPFYVDKAARDQGIDLKPSDFIPPQHLVESTDELDLGGRKIRLTAHGVAHTDADLSIIDDKTKTFWLADLLFLGHIPVVDGSLLGWLRELEGLRSVKAELAIPGHGPVSTAWPGASDAELRYLTQLRDEVRTAIKQGKTLEYALEHVGQTASEEWQLSGEFHKRNVSKAFAELEWED